MQTKFFYCFFLLIGLWACSSSTEKTEEQSSPTTETPVATESEIPGRTAFVEAFESDYVDPRNITIWLPTNYGSDTSKKYTVLYMHDGQNLFDSEGAYGGIAWEVDETLQELIQEGKAQEAIVVGIWNTPKRFIEYAPAKPFDKLKPEIQESLKTEYGGRPVSDAYLKFIVEELKPYIDNNYQTYTDKEHTFMLGSSMGGLISAYAICEYPNVFGGVACISTHWPVSLKESTLEDFTMRDYLAENLPQDKSHKIYFDFGTETLDSLYEPYQVQIDEVMKEAGYDENNWVTQKFEGAKHNEESWQKRMDIPLIFLIGK